MSESEKRRHAFYADSDVTALLERQAWGNKGAFINQAIHRYVHPPYQLKVPATLQEMGAADLLQGANQEVIASGLSLYRFVKQNGELLERKIREDEGVQAFNIFFDYFSGLLGRSDEVS